LVVLNRDCNFAVQ